jgi:hypothetical protein
MVRPYLCSSFPFPALVEYTAPAEYLVPRVLDKPPYAYDVWLLDEFSIVDSSWAGKTTIDVGAAKQCRFDEWLLVVAWDES